MRLLRFLVFRFGLGYDYSNALVDLLANVLSLGSPASKRQQVGAVLLKKIVTGDVDCPNFLAKVYFRVPISIHSNDRFCGVCSLTSYFYKRCTVHCSSAFMRMEETYLLKLMWLMFRKKCEML
ncbi:hypothetical protein J6590_045416 [Homalodisca vitripennis]|nr:hypothetical protein J6590_045416 [Homalodisca vitripennis]